MNKYIRKFIRARYLDLFGAIKRPTPYVHILCGHTITSQSGHGNEKDLKRFERLLTKLHKYCDFINIETAVEMITNHKKVERPTIAFTFDDGFEDCYYGIAPVLEKFGVNAMFFINPNFANAAENNDEAYIKNFTDNITMSPGKKPMSWAQIKDLRCRGFLFGAHTLDHYMVNHGSTTELRNQIVKCRDVLEQHLGEHCEYFAWHFGKLTHINESAVKIACETYKYVFSQSDHKHYFSFEGKVINRRHFETWWPFNHVRYFVSCRRL